MHIVFRQFTVYPALRSHKPGHADRGCVSTGSIGTIQGLDYEPSAKGRLKEYAGEWVALDDGNVIAHDASAIAVLQSARDQGVRKPHILFVEDIEDGVSRIGF